MARTTRYRRRMSDETTKDIAAKSFLAAVILGVGFANHQGYQMSREAALHGAEVHASGGDFECATEQYLRENNTQGELLVGGTLAIGATSGYLSAKPGDVKTSMFDAGRARCQKLGYNV